MNKKLADIDIEEIGKDYKVIERVMPKLKVEEVHYNLESDPLLREENIFPYEMNIIEYPIFSLNDKAKINTSMKYIFNEAKNQYIEIIPPSASGGNKILQEFDERLFYSIMQLSKQQNSKTVITDYFTLAKYANISYTRYLSRIKEGIERLRGCTIILNNAFYVSQQRGILNDIIELNILQSKRILTFEDYFNMPETEKNNFKKYFRNKKIKEILILNINDFIFDNIKNKGYLSFDSDKLLKLKGISRKLYLLLMKWQGYEKKSEIVRSCKFLASHISLSWNTRNTSSTINNLEKACKNLVELNFLKDFQLEKRTPLKNSIIKFTFFTVHDHDKLKTKEIEIIKENDKLSCLTGYESLNIVKTEERIIDTLMLKEEEIELIEEKLTDEQKNEINKICTKGKEKITLEVAYKLISDNLIEGKDFDYLYYCLEKTIKESTRAAIAYFNKIVASESNKMEYENNKKIKEKAEKQEQLFIFSNAESQKLEEKKNIEVEEKYKNLSEIEQKEYEKKYNILPLRVRKTMSIDLYIKTLLKENLDN